MNRKLDKDKCHCHQTNKVDGSCVSFLVKVLLMEISINVQYKYIHSNNGIRRHMIEN